MARLFRTLNEGFEGGDVQTRREAFETWLAQRLDNLSLPMLRHMPVTHKGSRLAFMAEVLAPGLPFLGPAAKTLAEPRQRIPEAVGLGVGQARRRERPAEYLPYRRRAAPRRPRQALRDKAPVRAAPTCVDGNNGSSGPKPSSPFSMAI